MTCTAFEECTECNSKRIGTPECDCKDGYYLDNAELC